MKWFRQFNLAFKAMQSAFTVHIIQTGQHANFSLISTFLSSQQYKNLTQNKTLQQPKFMNWEGGGCFMPSHVFSGLSFKTASRRENEEFGLLDQVDHDQISRPSTYRSECYILSVMVLKWSGRVPPNGIVGSPNSLVGSPNGLVGCPNDLVGSPNGLVGSQYIVW